MKQRCPVQSRVGCGSSGKSPSSLTLPYFVDREPKAWRHQGLEALYLVYDRPGTASPALSFELFVAHTLVL